MDRKIMYRLYGNCGRKNKLNRDNWVTGKLSAINSGARLLDVGAGDAPYRRFCKHLQYVSQDFCQYDGKGDGLGLQTGDWDVSKIDIVCDIVDIPEPDGSYDAILCTEVFQHIPDPVGAIREFARVLKKGGRLILTTPVSSLTHFAPYYFYNGFSRYFFENYLPNCGFQISELKYNGNYFEYVATEMQRIPYIAGRYSRMGVLRKVMYMIISIVVLRLLSKLSANDLGSSEVLCQGIHIVAEKK